VVLHVGLYEVVFASELVIGIQHRYSLFPEEHESVLLVVVLVEFDWRLSPGPVHVVHGIVQRPPVVHGVVERLDLFGWTLVYFVDGCCRVQIVFIGFRLILVIVVLIGLSLEQLLLGGQPLDFRVGQGLQQVAFLHGGVELHVYQRQLVQTRVKLVSVLFLLQLLC